MAYGHDPRNEPGEPPRPSNLNPGGGKERYGNDGGGAQPRSIFDSYTTDNNETGRAWREDGREQVEEWFDESDPVLFNPQKERGHYDTNRTRMQNLMDYIFAQASHGSTTSQKLLVELRVGKTVAQQELRSGSMDDGVSFAEEATKFRDTLRADLEASGVDTSLLDEAVENYLWSNQRAEESPPDEPQEA